MIQEPTPTADAADIGHYLSVLRTRKWSVILITALVVGSALFFSFRQTPIYESTSKILVKPVASPTQVTTATSTLISLETEREIMQSTEVAQRAAEDIEPPESAEALIEHLEVTIPGETQVLEVTFSDPNPLRAQDGAKGFTDAYLGYKTEQATAAIEDLRRPLQAQIDELSAQLDALGIGDATTATQDRDVLISQIAVLRSQLAPLNSLVVDPGDVIQAANLPSEAASPNHLLNGALALFVGLALGVAFAFLRERLDDRLQGREDLEARAGAPVLAVIPKVQGVRKKDREAPVTLVEPRSPASEAYRTLRTAVNFLASERGMQTLMVASADSGEGKTTTAANLAVVMAQAGKRVILLSADLRKPRIHRFFDLVNDVGVVSYLAGESSLTEALRDPGIPNLRVMTSGPIPTTPAELLGSEAMGELLAELRDLCDFLIVDTPAVLAVSDALTLMPLADGVLYVAHAEATTRGALGHARAQLDQVNSQVFGSVLNAFDPSKAKGYQYRYYYQYRYAERGREAASYPTVR
jgi:capsular exopolysaccharide synthesis family protein